MTKNVTLRIDEAILHKARHEAVGEKKSLSQWLTELITKTVTSQDQYEKTKQRMLKRMRKGFYLGGKALTKEEIHDRQILR